jgi:fructokinase
MFLYNNNIFFSPFVMFLYIEPGWGNVDVLTGLGIKELGLPFRFDTDVNAPALAEYTVYLKGLKSSSDSVATLSSCAYITVGTGVGVGIVCNSQTVHGLVMTKSHNRRIFAKNVFLSIVYFIFIFIFI